jgi:hypothetical protein
MQTWRISTLVVTRGASRMGKARVAAAFSRFPKVAEAMA